MCDNFRKNLFDELGLTGKKIKEETAKLIEDSCWEQRWTSQLIRVSGFHKLFFQLSANRDIFYKAFYGQDKVAFLCRLERCFLWRFHDV